ncbi:hypothetical protein LEP1GSC052_4241 [Leptospira kmetyi serovar Malaysia str. Bejo-Iso9]|nr:hypothetical protein LEP1GSC052_4241 [Leptospira kmetyi serovar Malaysia str. Bejo-Iso9]
MGDPTLFGDSGRRMISLDGAIDSTREGTDGGGGFGSSILTKAL